ncbi:MAG: monovalent cation/H(+) antiporter subunit G [Thermoplasmata archaeon]
MSLGCVVMFTAALALIRFDHVFMRLHASAKASTGGVLCFLVGLLLRTGLIPSSGKIILVIVFILLTGPILSHALGRAAHVGAGMSAEIPFEEVDVFEDEEEEVE